MKKKILLLLFSPGLLTAQLPGSVDFDSEQIRQEFINDLNVYSLAYTRPVLDVANFNQLAGWSQTAKTLDPWAVRIGFYGALSFADAQNLKFDFYEQPFSDNIDLQNPGDNLLPTALGGPTEQVFIYTVTSRNGTEYSGEIEAFSGITTPGNSVPNLVPQVSLGLPGNFEMTMRLFPSIKAAGVVHSEFGLGVKHQLSQYLTRYENFHWNVGVFYDISSFGYEPDIFLDGEDQKIRLQSQSLFLQTVASYDYGIVSVFAGLGLYTYKNAFGILGTYRYKVSYNAGPVGPLQVEEAFSATDPVNIANKQTGVIAELGATLRIIKLLSLTASYSLGQQNTLSAGFTFNIGNADN